MSERTTIVIPGFMGTNLHDAESGRVLWSSPRLFVTDLRKLRFEESGGSKIKLGGDFWPVYRPLMAGLRRTGRRVLYFGYDWRRSTLEAVERFEDFVLANTDGKFDIVAHSMGCLVSALWIARGKAERVGRFIGIAFPARGVEMAVSALLLGYSKLAFYNLRANMALVRDLAAEVPSLYEMLPPLPGAFERSTWPTELKVDAGLLRAGAETRNKLEASFPMLAGLARTGRAALIAGIGGKTEYWDWPAGSVADRSMKGWGRGDGWVVQESARIDGVPTFGFRPRFRDALGLGVFLPVNYMVGSHPQLPMYGSVRRAVTEFLDSGRIESLSPY